MEIPKVKTDVMSFDQAMLDIGKGKIRIPDFQRDFVWERNQIINLLDSIYRHYPIGSFLLWKTNEDITANRNIGDIAIELEKDGPFQYVLDGQQRLTSFYASLEQAEIKVRVSGRTVKKKLEIYFDLDEEVFVADPFESNKPKNIYKAKGLQKIDGYSDYFAFFDKLVAEIERLDFDLNKVASWISRDLDVSFSSSVKRINNLIHCGLLEKDYDKDYDHIGFANNISILKNHNSEKAIELLSKHFSYFMEMLSQLLQTPEIDEIDLIKQLNEKFSLEIKRQFIIRRRLAWLHGLGLGDYSEPNFTLYETGKRTIEKILQNVEDEKLQQENNEKELRRRYFSVKQITSSNVVMFTKELDDIRLESLAKVIDRFRSYPFSVIYVLDQPIDIACEIFERINNSGKVLNIVDLMVAKTYSATFNLRQRLSEFHQELKQQNYASIPEITIIQCVAAINFKTLNRKSILQLDKETFENTWDKVLESIRKAIDFLKATFKLSDAKIIPYNAIIIPLSYYFYFCIKGEDGKAAKEQLSKWFWRVSFSTRYDSTLEAKVAEDIRVVDRIIKGKKAEFRYEMPSITIEKLIGQKLNLGSAFCKSILCLYNNAEAREFIDNSQVNLTSFSKFNSAELHHVFPQKYLKEHQADRYDMKDSIVNIALVSSKLNKQYRDRAPSDYMAECAKENSDINISLKSHFIQILETSGLMEDDYENYLNGRANNILYEIKKRIGELAPIEVDFERDEKYVIEGFENSIRSFIEKKLATQDYDYWDKLDPGFRQGIESRQKDWLKQNPTHKSEKHRLIDYCQIMEYFNIIKANWDFFESIFKSKSELKKHFENINNFRNAFMHSRPIELSTKKLAEASLIWFDNILSF